MGWRYARAERLEIMGGGEAVKHTCIIDGLSIAATVNAPTHLGGEDVHR